MNRLKLNQNGVSLIEVLASVVLLFIILTSFFSFFNNSLVFSSKNEEELVAFNLARKTLKIVEAKYNNTLDQTQFLINCSNYPTSYPVELIAELENSKCNYSVNGVSYYPEISLTKKNYTENTITGVNTLTLTALPVLYIINIKIYNSPLTANRKLLSETFGYIRGKT
ncbi:type IV pilus modification PilV family protein [Pseudoneobacillus sp. C159]